MLIIVMFECVCGMWVELCYFFVVFGYFMCVFVLCLIGYVVGDFD